MTSERDEAPIPLTLLGADRPRWAPRPAIALRAQTFAPGVVGAVDLQQNCNICNDCAMLINSVRPAR
jgi:hypothetical protein